MSTNTTPFRFVLSGNPPVQRHTTIIPPHRRTLITQRNIKCYKHNCSHASRPCVHRSIQASYQPKFDISKVMKKNARRTPVFESGQLVYINKLRLVTSSVIAAGKVATTTYKRHTNGPLPRRQGQRPYVRFYQERHTEYGIHPASNTSTWTCHRISTFIEQSSICPEPSREDGL